MTRKLVCYAVCDFDTPLSIAVNINAYSYGVSDDPVMLLEAHGRTLSMHFLTELTEAEARQVSEGNQAGQIVIPDNLVATCRAAFDFAIAGNWLPLIALAISFDKIEMW